MSKFGLYSRFIQKYNLPFLFVTSFLLGCATELVMIKWSVGNVNFYDTVIRRETSKAALTILEREQKGVV